ncbi:sensor histidine kinase [Carboxylicivirga marina]|uniref:histidine kinase n=1 Tax=Carboxylicivirga marina TaxID=2800988 RepID=A0ABS1HKT0_9BACT|nr:HAMP domain-containing sensor histidine kinase [Carboxylicivirga marina]MBK3518210.1 DUF4154 domain-containing protein [Carboxylicivirga marina]
MYKKKFCHIVIMMLLFIVNGAMDIRAQEIERSELVGAYTFNFARLSSSEMQRSLPTYNIALLTEEESLVHEFKAIESTLKINDKKIKLKVDKSVKSNYNQCCMVVVGDDKQKYYDAIFEMTKGKDIILVCINYPNPRNILFNIYDTPDGNILFEINKGNIYQRNISIKKEIELMGGTEVDVKELYLQAQEKLVDTEKQLHYLKADIDSANQLIDSSEKEINNYKKEIVEYAKTMNQQKQELNQLQNKSAVLSDKLSSQNEEVVNSKKDLAAFQDSLSLLKYELKFSSEEIENNRRILLEQRDEINSKELVLHEKNKVIGKQKMTVVAFIAGFIITLTILILLYRSEKQKRQQNKLLAQKTQELEKLNSTKDKLFRIISHDLLSPFSGMLGISNILDLNYDELKDSERKDYIGLINNEMENYLKLLNNLLEWSKLQTDDIKFSPTVCKLEDIIQSEINNVNISASHKSIKVRFENEKQYLVLADCNMISIMVRNLLMNAIKYSDKNSVVEVKCTKKTNEKGKMLTEVSVIDNGIGFDEKRLKMALAEGVMSSQPGTSGEKGTGLGLFLCNEFAEKHGHQLKIESSTGKGSKISFSLETQN